MKKLFSAIISVILIFLLTVTAFAVDEQPVKVNAKAYVLMEQNTGQVLLEQNKDEKLYPASVTKIMTLLLVVEAVEDNKISLQDKVTTSSVAAGKGGSQIWLREGEVMSVDELLKATAVYSANDACTALGEFVAGSDEAFVKRMNERAGELGMKNTHFDNCTGLDDETTTHLTTAYDIALMSRELMKHELIKNYTTVWMDTLRDGKTELVNTNKLIRFYEGATGLKTGTTSKAGCCVSATATREGTSLIAVVLGADNSTDRFEGAKAILNWGFANYSTVTPSLDKKLVTDVKVILGEENTITPQVPKISSVLVPKGRENDILQDISLVTEVEAPVEANQVLGTVSVKLDGKEIGSYNLTSPKFVERLTFSVVFMRMLGCLCRKK